MEFILTSRGKPCLLVDNFQHRRFRRTQLSTTWVCLKSERQKCRGAVKVSHQNVIIKKTAHTCVPNVAEIEVKRALQRCRRRVVEDLTTPVCKIFQEELAIIYEKGYNLVTEVPSYDNAKTSLCAARRRASAAAENPETMQPDISNNRPTDCENSHNGGADDSEPLCDMDVANSEKLVSNAKKTCFNGTKKKQEALLMQQGINSVQGNTSVQYLYSAIQVAGGQEGLVILPDASESSSFRSSHDILGRPATHISNSVPPCGVTLKQEPQQHFYSTSISLPSSSAPSEASVSEFGDNCTSFKQSLPTSNHSSNSQPPCVEIKQEPDADYSPSNENSLPCIRHTFSLTPNANLDSAASSDSTNERNCFDMRIELLGKNWVEKMKSLKPDQRIYAEKLINDVLFEAELGRLSHGCHVEPSA